MKKWFTLLLLVTATSCFGYTTSPSCSWDKPGANRYTGDTLAALDAYSDLSESTKAALRAKMAAHKYDDVVIITRDAIVGEGNYLPGIYGMHFGGAGRVCATVSRQKWKPESAERGLVYCADGQCILVPAVCGNVSRIDKRQPREEIGAGGGGSAPNDFSGSFGAVSGPQTTSPTEYVLIASPSPSYEAPIVMPPMTWPGIDEPPGWHHHPVPPWTPVPPPHIPPVSPVPEPAEWLLMIVGGFMIITFANKKGVKRDTV